VTTRVRITNPESLFHGEEGTILRYFEENGLGSPAYRIAMDSRGFGEQRLGLAFGAHEVVIFGGDAEVAS